MGRTACTEPQCLYSRAKPVLPLWAVRPVQSLSACTRVYFTLLALHVEDSTYYNPHFCEILFLGRGEEPLSPKNATYMKQYFKHNFSPHFRSASCRFDH
jgi:hypothetical protein